MRFTFESLHFWPNAPEGEEGYLRHPHRHLFHVEAVKDVTHDDRDIEFISFKREMFTHCEVVWGSQLHSDSCEAMARNMVKRFGLRSCRVFEDNENGAEVSAVD